MAQPNLLYLKTQTARETKMTPTEFATNFFEQMLNWEDWYYAEKKKPEYETDNEFIKKTDQESRSKLELILRSFLTESAFSKIGQEKLETLGVGRPRLYDQEAISCTESSSLKFEVISKNRKKQNSYSKYLVLQEEGTYKIDQAYQSIDGQNWRKKNSI